MMEEMTTIFELNGFKRGFETGFEIGLELGFERGKLQVVKKLIGQFSDQEILKIAEITPEQMEQLKKEL